MTTTLTADTTSRTKFYLSDLLNNTVSDPTARGTKWIFANVPSKKQFDSTGYPMAVINDTENSIKKLVFDNTKHSPPTLRFEITLWTAGEHALKYRDTIADDMVTALKTPTSTDGTTALQNARLHFKRASMRDEDAYQGTLPDIIRVKIIDIEFTYGS